MYVVHGLVGAGSMTRTYRDVPRKTSSNDDLFTKYIDIFVDSQLAKHLGIRNNVTVKNVLPQTPGCLTHHLTFTTLPRSHDESDPVGVVVSVVVRNCKC